MVWVLVGRVTAAESQFEGWERSFRNQKQERQENKIEREERREGATEDGRKVKS